MLRKRTNAHATVDDHMRTVCSVGTPAVAVAQLPAPTMTGRLVVTPVEKMCTALGPDSKQAPYWVELRGDVLTFHPSGGDMIDKASIALEPKQVAFVAKVEPPPPAITATPGLKAIAEKLLTVDYLAVYTSSGQCYWLASDGDAQDFARWQTVRWQRTGLRAPDFFFADKAPLPVDTAHRRSRKMRRSATATASTA